MTFTALEVAALLPLPPATFHILIALAEGDRHGYAIIQDTSLRSGGAIRLSAGSGFRISSLLPEPAASPRSRPDAALPPPPPSVPASFSHETTVTGVLFGVVPAMRVWRGTSTGALR